MALVGSLIVSKQLAGCRPDPGLGNNLSFVPCPGGWPLKKKLQTSIFLSAEVELQNDEMVFALIHLFFLFLFFFLSFFLLILLHITLFFTPFRYLLHHLSPSHPSAHLYFSSPPLALFFLIFPRVAFPSQILQVFSCCAWQFDILTCNSLLMQ